MKQVVQRANPRWQKQRLECPSLGALPGHMAGLTTAPAQTRERTGWGAIARLEINETLRRLTRIAHTAFATFNTDTNHGISWASKVFTRRLPLNRNRQSSSDPQTRLNHNLRRRMKRSRYQFRLEDHKATLRSLSSAGAGQI